MPTAHLHRAPPHLVRLALLLGLAAAGACSDGGGTEDPEPACPMRLAAGEVRASLSACAQDMASGLLAIGRPPDGVLANARVRFTVRSGAEGHAIYGMTGGHLVDAVRVGADPGDGWQLGGDGLREFALAVDLHLLRPTAMEVFEEGDARGLRVRGELEPFPVLALTLNKKKPDVSVTHEYLLRPDSTVIELRTRVTPNAESKVKSVLVSDVMLWGGDLGLWLPGHGGHDLPTAALGDVMGVAPRHPKTGLSAAAVAATEKLSIVDAGGILALVWPKRDLQAEGTVYTRFLALGGPQGDDLAAAMQAAAAAQDKAGGWRQIGGSMPGAAEGMIVQVRDDQGKPLTRCRPAPQGALACPVPPGASTLVPGWMGNGNGQDGGAGQFDEALAVPIPAGQGAQVTVQAPRPARLPVQVTDAAGLPIAFRLTVQPVGGDGGLNRSFADADGDAVFALAPGAYKLWLHHGPRYSQAFVERTLVAGDNQPWKAALTEVVAAGDWVAADLHVHAEQSTDSSVVNTRRLQGALAEDLGYVVSTDHDFVTDYRPWLKQAGLEGRLLVANGAEVSTVGLGHFNVWPLPLDPDRAGNGTPKWMGLSATELLALLHGSGAARVVQSNHPRFKSASYFEKIGFDPLQTPEPELRFDAMELVNGIGHSDTPLVIGDWMALLNRGLRVTGTATSDCHGVSSPVGSPRTLIRLPPGTTRAQVTAAQLDASLRSGAAIATGGPLLEISLHDEAGKTALIGTRLDQPQGAVVLKVRLQAPDWMPLGQLTVYRNGQVLKEADVAGTAASAGRREVLWTLPAEAQQPSGAPAWFVAVHKPGAGASPGIARPAWAIANPVFL